MSSMSVVLNKIAVNKKKINAVFNTGNALYDDSLGGLGCLRGL